MEAFEGHVADAHKCVTAAIDVSPGSEPGTAERERYWIAEAQVHATLAVAAALHELRTMLVRDNDPDAGAFIRVAGRITTER